MCFLSGLKKRPLRCGGFTLVEMVTVLAILGIAIGMFYTTWMLTWESVENHNTRADLLYDGYLIMERVTDGGRLASQIDVTLGQKQVAFSDNTGVVFETYTMTADGNLTLNRPPPAAPRVLSVLVDFDNSLFREDGNGLLVDLTLKDNPFSGDISVNVATEIYPRN